MRLPALPRLASGKVDYDALRRHLDAPAAEPEGLLDAYRSVFFPRPVDAGDSFAALGGDSLRHVELAMILEKRLGHTPAGWEGPAVGDLARMDAERPGAAPCSGSST